MYNSNTSTLSTELICSQEPGHRIPLDRITTHPFFDVKFPVDPLQPIPEPKGADRAGGTDLPNCGKNLHHRLDVPILPSKTQRMRWDLRHLTRQEISAGIQAPADNTRRIVSDPLPRKGSLASELIALTSRARTSSSAHTPSLITESNSLPSSSVSHTDGTSGTMSKGNSMVPLSLNALLPPDTNIGPPKNYQKLWTSAINASAKENVVPIQDFHSKLVGCPTGLQKFYLVALLYIAKPANCPNF